MQLRKAVSTYLLLCGAAFAQDTTAVLEGRVLDASGAIIGGANVRATNPATGYTRSQTASSAGTYHLTLPAAVYDVDVESPNFGRVTHKNVELSVSQTTRIDFSLAVTRDKESVTVSANAPLVETSSNEIGNVVTGRQLVDLPLNGRNFTQLGLLQPGVAPLTAGLAAAGGSLRGGQAYAVNGQRPESNNYLLDGVTNVNRVDGGYALRTPVDAIQEFRILTLNAPAEYGGTGGATTTVVTRSGTNEVHGAVYEFLRNDNLDARNFFAAAVEPLKQNQFGATLGGPIRKNKDFFFGFYEGFRNVQGVTQSATVPSDAERSGDFSGVKDPVTGQSIPLINYFTGEPFPGNRIPAPALSPVALNLLQFYPHANAGPNLFITTQNMHNQTDQGGVRFDHFFNEKDQLSFRYARSVSANIDPLSVAGANVPGFPVGEDLGTHSAALSETHVFGAAAVNVARIAFFRNVFETDKPINRTKASSLGFNYRQHAGGGGGSAVLHRERLCQHWGSHHRTSRHGAEHV